MNTLIGLDLGNFIDWYQYIIDMKWNTKEEMNVTILMNITFSEINLALYYNLAQETSYNMLSQSKVIHDVFQSNLIFCSIRLSVYFLMQRTCYNLTNILTIKGIGRMWNIKSKIYYGNPMTAGGN